LSTDNLERQFAKIVSSPVPEWRRFLLRYAAVRPLTLNLLQQGWCACQANETRHERGGLLGQMERPEAPAPVNAKEMYALGDNEVEALYHASLQQYARFFGRQGGIIA
jgi:hypothetical protein